MRFRRTIRWSAALLVALFLLPLAVSAAPPERPTVKVDPRVLEDVKDGEATFWVVMRQRADLSPAYAIKDWDARGRFVVQRLQEAANASQVGVRGLLQGQGKFYES